MSGLKQRIDSGVSPSQRLRYAITELFFAQGGAGNAEANTFYEAFIASLIDDLVVKIEALKGESDGRQAIQAPAQDAAPASE